MAFYDSNSISPTSENDSLRSSDTEEHLVFESTLVHTNRVLGRKARLPTIKNPEVDNYHALMRNRHIIQMDSSEPRKSLSEISQTSQETVKASEESSAPMDLDQKAQTLPEVRHSNSPDDQSLPDEICRQSYGCKRQRIQPRKVQPASLSTLTTKDFGQHSVNFAPTHKDETYQRNVEKVKQMFITGPEILSAPSPLTMGTKRCTPILPPDVAALWDTDVDGEPIDTSIGQFEQANPTIVDAPKLGLMGGTSNTSAKNRAGQVITSLKPSAMRRSKVRELEFGFRDGTPKVSNRPGPSNAAPGIPSSLSGVQGSKITRKPLPKVPTKRTVAKGPGQTKKPGKAPQIPVTINGGQNGDSADGDQKKAIWGPKSSADHWFRNVPPRLNLPDSHYSASVMAGEVAWDLAQGKSRSLMFCTFFFC